jgi:hypothetical protein
VNRSVALALFLGLFAGLLAPAAHAAEYEVFIDVRDEDQIYDLYVSEQISETTFNLLVELMRRGVDLNRASREDLYALPNLSFEDVDAILAYREDTGHIPDPAILVINGVVTERKLASIAPFLVVRQPGRRLAATNGFVRLGSQWAPSDGALAPPASLQARVNTVRHLTLGASLLHSRLRVSDVRWDPSRQALSAEEPRSRLDAPKYFAQWDAGNWAVVAGSYRAGFGQRLTFDNSGRFSPNGFYLDDATFRGTNLTRLCKESQGELEESPCTGAAGDVYVTPDFRWRDGLRGVSAGFRHAALPVGWLQGYVFSSYQDKGIYQYELYDRAACSDPHDDDDPACSAPDVFSRSGQSNPLDPQSRFSYQTLPAMYDEMLAGANVSWFRSRRSHVGITGYGAQTRWRSEGADLDFQEWASTPYGGPFGAIGVDAAWGREWSDLFLEVARSIDSMPGHAEGTGGGGFGALLRHTSTFRSQELELVLRYYDVAFANPYARSISAADEFEGNRARDEAGGRIRYTAFLADRLTLRALTDVWAQPREKQPKLRSSVRADVDVSDWFRPGLWTSYQNKDLRSSGRQGCYAVSVEEDENGEPIPCGGEQITLTPRMGFRPHKRVAITTQYQHRFVDDEGAEFDGHFRQDASAWLMISTNPWRSLRLRLRGRYLFEDISDPAHLEQSLWSYFETSYRFAQRIDLRLRYDLLAWLDERDSTLARTPSPEHRLRLLLEARF